MLRVKDGMPVVRQKYPGGEKEAVFDAAFVDRPRQHGEYRRVENLPPGQQPAGKNQRSATIRRRSRGIAVIIASNQRP
jgi:hypothetical protein